MPIKQTIDFKSENSYFAGFLQELIILSGIKGSVSQNGNQITLMVDSGDTKALNSFSELSQKYLPHSLFLGDIATETIEGSIEESKFASGAYDIGLCPRCLEMLLDPGSDRYLDDSVVCNHYGNTSKTFSDTTIFTPNYSDGDTVLVTNSEKIDQLFLLTEDEKRALFSIEKPTLKVTVYDEELKSITGKNFLNIKMPYNTRSTLAALNAKESGFDYIFFRDMTDKKVVVVQKNILFVKDNNLTKPLEDLNSDTVINRFLNITEDAGFSNAIGANLSNSRNVSFLVKNDVGVKKVITFQDFNLEEILQGFAADDTKTRLFENLKVQHRDVAAELVNNPKFGLFETIAAILELNGRGFEAVSDKSTEFRGNGGLKIDTNFKDGGFDYGSFIGSIISFKLAGVDTHYLAYSIFEAIGDMAISTLNQLKNEFKIDKFVMMGDMFENTVLFSRILSKFQLSNPYFPKSIGLDG